MSLLLYSIHVYNEQGQYLRWIVKVLFSIWSGLYGATIHSTLQVTAKG